VTQPRGLIVGQAPPTRDEKLPPGYLPFKGPPEKRLARLAGLPSPDELWKKFDRLDLIGWCPPRKPRKAYHQPKIGYTRHNWDGHTFPMRDARLAASRLIRFGDLGAKYAVVVLCGRKVADAFDLQPHYVPWADERDGVRYLVMPHPSGVSHYWNSDINWRYAAGAFRTALKYNGILPRDFRIDAALDSRPMEAKRLAEAKMSLSTKLKGKLAKAAAAKAKASKVLTPTKKVKRRISFKRPPEDAAPDKEAKIGRRKRGRPGKIELGVAAEQAHGSSARDTTVKIEKPSEDTTNHEPSQLTTKLEQAPKENMTCESHSSVKVERADNENLYSTSLVGAQTLKVEQPRQEDELPAQLQANAGVTVKLEPVDSALKTAIGEKSLANVTQQMSATADTATASGEENAMAPADVKQEQRELLGETRCLDITDSTVKARCSGSDGEHELRSGRSRGVFNIALKRGLRLTIGARGVIGEIEHRPASFGDEQNARKMLRNLQKLRIARHALNRSKSLEKKKRSRTKHKDVAEPSKINHQPDLPQRKTFKSLRQRKLTPSEETVVASSTTPVVIRSRFFDSSMSAGCRS